GVDRLDYSKGISQRIDAFSCFLDGNPAMRGRVTFIQITPKSRSQVPEYAQMERDIAEQIGATNGKYADLDWTPIRYTNRTFGHPSLMGLYRMARVGLVTPLRDGMNLVAKEYVASQSAEDPGVLILSRFAGAASELEGALVVNPYDSEATAGAILRALSMTLDERKERWAAMMARLESNTIQHWCRSFLDTLHRDASPDAATDGTGAVQREGVLEARTVSLSGSPEPRLPWRAYKS
ncbi:MAG TPA: trehalose-6-phosphate synthase, partial [Beijerinckiaceae bacterium]|nr:trehalose-6-phosphate synthase [Beijerinckiaceae bacterium]